MIGQCGGTFGAAVRGYNRPECDGRSLREGNEMAAVSKTVKDPVCGMQVDPTQAAGQAEYKGRTYYFCEDVCLQKFEARPELYVPDTTSGQSTAA